MMLFIPFPFSHLFTENAGVGREAFPQGEVSES